VPRITRQRLRGGNSGHGAAGLTARRVKPQAAGTGVEIELALVSQRESGMTPQDSAERIPGTHAGNRQERPGSPRPRDL
jgi:hypothetical protein